MLKGSWGKVSFSKVRFGVVGDRPYCVPFREGRGGDVKGPAWHLSGLTGKPTFEGTEEGQKMSKTGHVKDGSSLVSLQVRLR